MAEKQPIIFALDDDQQVLRAIARDLRAQYKKEYRILSTTSALEALEALSTLKKQGETVALFLSDQRMPEMGGVDFLEKTKAVFPESKRVLLTAYSDTSVAIKAINDVRLDYYLMKPWDPPEEKLFPVLTDLLEEWLATFTPEFVGIKLVGYQFSPKSHAIKDFLAGNLIPYQWLDISTHEKAEELLTLHGVQKKDLPAIFFEDNSLLLLPEIAQIAEKIGKKTQAAEKLYDVVIIGAGPAGLAAAVYGASEGLKTLLIERRAPGGQAGTSSRIENYLGFPTGLSGSDLARRAITQATRFGTEFLSPQEVQHITLQDGYKVITLSTNEEILAKSVLIASGVAYRKLEIPRIEKFTGAGVYYGAANTEAGACREKDVYVVGGGNSAGQAAMYLSRFAHHVFIVIRKSDLSSSMSQYLIDQLGAAPNISLIPNSEVIEVCGGDFLEEVGIQHLETKEVTMRQAGALFVFIGAKPSTEWVPGEVLKDEKGFILTGRELMNQETFAKLWKKNRDPYLLETSIEGVFAAGDVRSGAMNRVASAVGEGAMSIKFVHEYLRET